jgi:hypothetical protein
VKTSLRRHMGRRVPRALLVPLPPLDHADTERSSEASAHGRRIDFHPGEEGEDDRAAPLSQARASASFAMRVLTRWRDRRFSLRPLRHSFVPVPGTGTCPEERLPSPRSLLARDALVTATSQFRTRAWHRYVPGRTSAFATESRGARPPRHSDVTVSYPCLAPVRVRRSVCLRRGVSWRETPSSQRRHSFVPVPGTGTCPEERRPSRLRQLVLGTARG